MILSAAYALWLYRRVIFGELDKPSAEGRSRDLTAREIAILAPLVVLTIFFGVYPAPVLDVTAASVEKLVAQLRGRRSARRRQAAPPRSTLQRTPRR